VKHNNYQTAEELTRNHVNCSGRPHSAGTDDIVSLVNETSHTVTEQSGKLCIIYLFIYF